MADERWIRGKNRERMYRLKTVMGITRVYDPMGDYEGYVKKGGKFSRRVGGEIVCRGEHTDLIHEAAEDED
jgi:hypothetical protein